MIFIKERVFPKLVIKLSNPCCPKCKSWEIVKRGLRYTKSQSKQLYRCNTCAYSFVDQDGFERMRYTPDIIMDAIFFGDAREISLFKIQKHLQQRYNLSISRKTINNWRKKYKYLLKEK